ncbi:MAG: heat-inducible transcriptional repressor HrcA [Alphaproteobacteria bacterium]|nr:heat-inducible transcriptional repressor HrcA [Alphaproteobacteria bacterium]
MINELNERSREIFKFIVDCYLETGRPVGSRMISDTSNLSLSPASIRNYMADLERFGLLYAPHTSAGRLPTDSGLRLYIDGLMEIGNLSYDEQNSIKASCNAKGRSFNEILDHTSNLLSGLSSCASLVIAPKLDKSLRQVQFVQLDARKILIVLVMDNGLVENRIMDMNEDISVCALEQACNYLNSKIQGKTISQTVKEIQRDIKDHKIKLDSLTADLIERGLNLPQSNSTGHIIVRGKSKLMADIKVIEDLERARALLSYLDEQNNMLALLENISHADGVQIFIGTENRIFNQTGWSMIISPYRDKEDNNIVGAIGVIGPTRLNYDRIIPMVDYTSRIVERMLADH